jgi:membrane associated rhomboid family serine protease
MSIFSRYHPGAYTEDQFLLEKRVVNHALFVSLFLLVVLWFVKIFEVEFDHDFASWGIYPLSIKGLRGILFGPLIHANFEHLIANSFSIFILTFSLFFFYRHSAYLIFGLIYFSAGLSVWFVGRDSLHIGASGVIYGLAAFLFLSGVISYNARLLTIALIVALIYGGLFWGIFPVKPEISWESHLWGGVMGFGIALMFRKSAPVNPYFKDENDDMDSDIVNETELDSIDPLENK